MDYCCDVCDKKVFNVRLKLKMKLDIHPDPECTMEEYDQQNIQVVSTVNQPLVQILLTGYFFNHIHFI